MRRMMAVQPAATMAGPRPKGTIRAPLPPSDQPLPEMVDRLSRVVTSQIATPDPTPISAIRAAKRQSRSGSLVGVADTPGMVQKPPPLPSARGDGILGSRAFVPLQ